MVRSFDELFFSFDGVPFPGDLLPMSIERSLVRDGRCLLSWAYAVRNSVRCDLLCTK